MSQISLQEVADYLNLSRVTISKVINNKPGVSAQTRGLVIDTLVKMGYQKFNPDSLLSETNSGTQKTNFIVIIATAPDFSDFWTKIINTISTSLASSNYDIIYSFIPAGQEDTHVLPNVVTSLEASGIILMNVYNERLIRRLSKIDIPKVYYDIPQSFIHQHFDSDILLLDGKKSVYEITTQIINSGKKTIGFIGDITYAETIFSRYEGYRKAMEDKGLPILKEYCFLSDPSSHFYKFENVNQILKKLDKLPDAFVCANDVVACMVIDIVKAKGKSVPRDIYVSGFDNINRTFNQPSILTTVQVDPQQVGTRLVQQMLFKIEQPDMPNEVVIMESKVIFRSSTGVM